jgi:hypothetical protein
LALIPIKKVDEYTMTARPITPMSAILHNLLYGENLFILTLTVGFAEPRANGTFVELKMSK